MRSGRELPDQLAEYRAADEKGVYKFVGLQPGSPAGAPQPVPVEAASTCARV